MSNSMRMVQYFLNAIRSYLGIDCYVLRVAKIVSNTPYENSAAVPDNGKSSHKFNFWEFFLCGMVV